MAKRSWTFQLLAVLFLLTFCSQSMLFFKSYKVKPTAYAHTRIAPKDNLQSFLQNFTKVPPDVVKTSNVFGWIAAENIVNRLETRPYITGNDIQARVWVSNGPCGLLVAVREDGLDRPPPETGNCAPSSKLVGLQTVEGTWKYRRAFGGCFDCMTANREGKLIDAWSNTRHACNPSNFKALSDTDPLRPEACSQVSTARAWWLDRNEEIYALQLTPFQCSRCAPIISVFGGMDHCQQPLEAMGEDELRPPAKDTFECVYPSDANVPPLARIRVPQNFLLDPAFSAEGGRWTEDGSQWKLTARDATIQKPRRNNESPSKLQGLCLIGDSHFERNWIGFKKMAKSMFDLGPKHVKLGINFMVSDGFDAPARFKISIREEMELCHEWLGRKSRNGKGAIILSIGSHQPRASTENLETFVRDLERFLKHQPQKYCVLVSPTLDSCHENIPGHFHTAARIAQNTWREQAKAAVTRAAIEKSTLKNLHYVDLFNPSAALHFGHCSNGDPVHWSRGFFYREHFRILFDAVQEYCG